MLFLDNEKAFDKVDHAFLFETMRAFHMPEPFVKAVEVLYKTATTSVKLTARRDDRSRTRRGSGRAAPLARCCTFSYRKCR